MPPRFFRPSALVASVALLAACEVPSGLPNWDTTWNVPSQSLSVSVGQVLPSGVSVAPDGGAFLVSLAPVAFAKRLADDCAECAALAGRVAPKPAFQARVSASTALPGDVQGGTLAAGGRIDVRVANGNGFDPLRPAAGRYGWATIVVRNGATVLARDSVNGATTALPPGGQLVRALTLAGASVTGAVTVDVVLDSPAGDPVTIDPSRTFDVVATPSPLRVTQATVMVRGAQVSQTTSADLDVSSSINDRVQSGRLLIDVKDPFAVGGAMSVRLTTPAGAVVTKALSVTGGDKGYAVAFSRDELRQLLGHSVTIVFAGSMSRAGALTVTPAQALAIATRFELVLTTND
jgi:hypothetical protein